MDDRGDPYRSLMRWRCWKKAGLDYQIGKELGQGNEYGLENCYVQG